MQVKPKQHISDLFTDKASLLVFTRDGKNYTYRAADITHIYTDSDDDTYIALEDKEPQYFCAHHDLVMYFWHLALNTGQSFDLRPICSLDEDDELYDDYKSPDLNSERKQKLAKRVKPLVIGQLI
jgi:hypothetical protein